jgi:predicted DNA-binding transcriptional regulator AlpA/ribosomal protein L12E/L44/L45/RPP1/RPP2
LSFPHRPNPAGETRWSLPTYVAIHQVLTNPVYAGAYCYGKTRNERYIDEQGQVRKRIRHLPQSEWAVFIPGHHEGYIDWATYETIQARLDGNTRPQPHQGGGALREGGALLQGLAVCGHCGRRLRTHYRGRNAAPGYHCAGKNIVGGRGVYCLNVGGVQIDEAVAQAFLEALEPAGIQAALMAAQQLETDHDAALAQWQLTAERARYEAGKAERRYRAVEPENWLVARGLETEWERRLRELDQAQAELARRQRQRPAPLAVAERNALLALGQDLNHVWSAPATTARDKKELLRTLLEEVGIAVFRDEYRAHLTLRWRGGRLTELDVGLPRSRPATVRTDEDTLSLLRRLAMLYPDAVIAGILNQQGRTTARGLRFTANVVGNLRRHWQIPRFEPSEESSGGELLSLQQAAKVLGMAPSTLHRWINDGFIAGEQATPGAPWQIRLTDGFRRQLVEDVPEGYVVMQKATQLLGASRQTVLQRVKRGELDAVHVCQGRRKGLRIRVIDNQPDLFNPIP